MKISCMTIGSKSELTNAANGGNFMLVRTQTPIANEKTILTGSGTMREPKKGDDKRKDPTLKVDNSKSNR
jgi:hypothetical protein